MKKFVVPSFQLKRALAKLGQAIDPAAPLPVLKNLYCKVTAGQVELIACNTELTIYYRLPCEAKEEFEALLPFEFLDRIVAVIRDCPMEIEVYKPHIKIKGDSDNFEIKPIGKLEEYPPLQAIPFENAFDLQNDILACLPVALITAAKPEASLQKSHVLLELSAGKITIASTDGGYYVYSREFTSEQQQHTQDLLLSPKVIKVLKGADSVKLCYTPGAISFVAGDITIVNTRSEEKFVNFRSVFPPEWPGNLSLQKADLLEALGKCALSSDQLHTTILTLSANEMKLAADDHLIKINVAIPCTYNGVVSKIVMNAEKVLKVLSQISHEEITLAIHNSNRAVVLSTQDAGYKGLVMPIALKD